MDDGSFQLTPEDDGFLEGVLAEMADELMAEESAWPSDNQFPDSLCVPQLNPAGSIPGDEQCNSVALPVAVANLNHSSSNNNSNSNNHNNHNHSNSDTTQSTKNGGNNNSDDDNNKNGPCRPDDAFLKLSFDAMAMVDPAGELLWENPAFHNLSLFAGAGEKVEGLRRLKACFLSGIPPERHITRKVLQAEGAAEVVLCSATQVLNQSVLWVVNQPFLPLLKQQQLAYPKASDYTDPAAKVRRENRLPTMLWVLYGKRKLSPSDGSCASMAPIVRMYYKCTVHRECRARMKIDLDGCTRSPIRVDASGTHNHQMEVVSGA